MTFIRQSVHSLRQAVKQSLCQWAKHSVDSPRPDHWGVTVPASIGTRWGALVRTGGFASLRLGVGWTGFSVRTARQLSTIRCRFLLPAISKAPSIGLQLAGSREYRPDRPVLPTHSLLPTPPETRDSQSIGLALERMGFSARTADAIIVLAVELCFPLVPYTWLTVKL